MSTANNPDVALTESGMQSCARIARDMGVPVAGVVYVCQHVLDACAVIRRLAPNRSLAMQAAIDSLPYSAAAEFGLLAGYVLDQMGIDSAEHVNCVMRGLVVEEILIDDGKERTEDVLPKCFRGRAGARADAIALREIELAPL